MSQSQLSQKALLKTSKGEAACIVQEYRRLAKKVEESNEAIIQSQDPKRLTELLTQNDDFFNGVKTPSTFAADCETLRVITETAVNQAYSVNLGPKPFTFNNVVSKMTSMYSNGDTLDWEAIGDWALRRGKTAPTVQPFMFGLESFEVKKKERAPTQRSKKDVIEQEQEVHNKDMSQAINNQLLARAKKLCEKLKQAGDMPVTKVIATKDGFSQSVQNAFELSHLVRDGKVGLNKDGHGKVIATANIQGPATNERRKQCVLHLRDIDFKKVEALI